MASSDPSAPPGAALSCALSGETPPVEPVVTPSGHLCSRRLLLTKLVDTGGIDPFDPDKRRTLDESQLIDLVAPQGSSSGAAVVPPRLPTATSFPSLLSSVQREYDALLLELYDTRRALEETRRELSTALYQNDAAVRVVARLSLERDAARERLASLGATGAAAGGDVVMDEEEEGEDGGGRKKRRRDEEAVPPGGAAKKAAAATAVGPAVVEPEAAPNNSNAAAEPPKDAKDEKKTAIPAADMDVMIATWKTLSSTRKSRTKGNAAKLNPDALAAYDEIDRKSLHRTNAKAGIRCVAVQRSTGLVVTGGRDKAAVVYDSIQGEVVGTLKGSTKELSSVDICQNEIDDEGDAKACLIATGSDDGSVRAYCRTSDAEDFALLGAAVPVDDNGGDDEGASSSPSPSPVVSVSAHPSGKHVLASSKAGAVAVFAASTSADAGGLTRLATLRDGDGGGEGETTKYEYASGCLHPDGLIYLAGTTDGTVHVWDLKTQVVASKLKGHDGHPITAIAFSENGYHFASASSSGSVIVWDLRKQKTVATLNVDESENDSNLGPAYGVAFDPGAKYLAYACEKGTRVVIVKDWNNVVCTLTATSASGSPSKAKGGKKQAATTGVSWADAGKWLVTCSAEERPIRFWGAPAASASSAADAKEG